MTSERLPLPPVVPPPPAGLPPFAAVVDSVTTLDGPVGDPLLDESPAQLAPLTASARTGASIINFLITSSYYAALSRRRRFRNGVPSAFKGYQGNGCTDSMTADARPE